MFKRFEPFKSYYKFIFNQLQTLKLFFPFVRPTVILILYRSPFSAVIALPLPRPLLSLSRGHRSPSSAAIAAGHRGITTAALHGRRDCCSCMTMFSTVALPLPLQSLLVTMGVATTALHGRCNCCSCMILSPSSATVALPLPWPSLLVNVGVATADLREQCNCCSCMTLFLISPYYSCFASFSFISYLNLWLFVCIKVLRL